MDCTGMDWILILSMGGLIAVFLGGTLLGFFN
jgi:hypothetical protein